MPVIMVVYFYGKLADVAGQKKLEIASQKYSDDLLKVLKKKLPELTSYSFLLSVNQEIVSDNRVLSSGDEIALLPPFSGG